jgi:GntR family transcriptional regulator, transcriptional repressor for pyruvate dehydrogenase complex
VYHCLTNSSRVMTETTRRPRSAVNVKRISPAYVQVAEQLRNLVIRGELQPGSRLPGEGELSTLFGVSRSTIREALRTLSSQHLVVTSRGVGGGSFIIHTKPDNVSDLLEVGLGLLSASDMTLDELLEARELLEIPAARYAAQRRTEEQLQYLRRSMATTGPTDRGRLFSGRERFETFTAGDHFHVAVLEAAGNRVVGVMARPMLSVLQRRFLQDQAPPRFWDQVTEDHQQILNRIEAGDPDGAAEAMSRHLKRNRLTYEQVDRQRREAAITGLETAITDGQRA